MRFALRLGDDLELSPVERGDADALFALVDANREHLARWLPWVESTRALEDSLGFIEGVLLERSRDKGLHCGIFSGGELCGMIGLIVDETAAGAELGYWIAREHEGRGLVTRATDAMIDYAFTELRLPRIVIYCATANVRSRAVPERLCLPHIGTTTTPDGARESYEVLAEEWQNLRTGVAT